MRKKDLGRFFSAVCIGGAVMLSAGEGSGAFQGRVGVSLKAQKDRAGATWSDSENNALSFTVSLEGLWQISQHWSLGSEIAGWSALGLGWADAPRVLSARRSGSEISQLYLEGSGRSLGVRVGRIALSEKESEWIYSDRSGGVVDNAMEGVFFHGEVSKQFSLGGGWIRSLANDGESRKIGEGKGIYFVHLSWRSSSYGGSLSAYYAPDLDLRDYHYDSRSLWGTLWGSSRLGRFSLQGLWIDAQESDGVDRRATMGGAVRWERSWGAWSARLTLAALNDGDYRLNLGGSSGFWGKRHAGEFGGEIEGGIGNRPAAPRHLSQKILGLELERHSSYGTWYAGAALDHLGGTLPGDKRRIEGYRLGYKKGWKKSFLKIEYRWTRFEFIAKEEHLRQKIRFDLSYRF